MSDAGVVAWGTDGLLEGREVSVPTGSRVSIGRIDGCDLDLRVAAETPGSLDALPPILLILQALGEGWVRVQVMSDGVVVGSRPITDRTDVDLRDGPVSVRFGAGQALMLGLTAEIPAAAPAAPLGLALELDDPVLPAPVQTVVKRGWIPLARQAFGRHAVALSVAAHLLLVALLAWWLSTLDWEAPRRPIVLTIDMTGRPDPDNPEATRGRDERRPDPGSDTSLDVDRPSTDAFEDGSFAGEIVGRALDETDQSQTEGIGRTEAGSFYAGRKAGRRTSEGAGGGDSETEGALHRALVWLAKHQGTDGTWDARAFAQGCGAAECAAAGTDNFRHGVTALALLPYLGAGHDHREGPWHRTVRNGLEALIAGQRKDGSFGRGEKRAYESAIALVALSEAFGLTSAEGLREPAQRTIDYWVRTQSDRGGWRYDPGDGAADTSVTGWVAMGLVAAQKAGLTVPDRTLFGCRDWFLTQIEPDGTVGYVGVGTGTTALLGVGSFVSTLLGRRDDPELRAVADRLAGELPRWADDPDKGLYAFGEFDPSHWYYGSLAAFQRGGTIWETWHHRLREQLLEHQVRAGHAVGSWDPRGQTGRHGGRVVMTALCALCLEVTYRYPRIVEATKPR